MSFVLYRGLELVAQHQDWITSTLWYCAKKCVGFLLLMKICARIEIYIRPMQSQAGIILDSGAEMHVCHDRSKLLNYRAYYVPRGAVGIGGIVPLLGVGDMEIETIRQDGNNATRRDTLHLYGVVYMPSAGTTLLSTEQLRLQGIFYSSEKQALYRKHGDCDVVVGDIEIIRNRPRLKTLVEEKLGLRTRNKPVQHLSFLSSWYGRIRSWCSQRLFGGTPSHEDAAVSMSELENEIDRLVWKLASQKQEIAGLKYSAEHNYCTVSTPTAASELNLATRLINYAQISSKGSLDTSDSEFTETSKLKSS